jgi:hypothetical protein
MDLVRFITARLDEDQAAAEARRGIFPSPAVEDNGAVWLHVKRGGNAVVAHYPHPVEGYGDMADLRAWADTGDGWTQDRALREIEAKREIVRRCARWMDEPDMYPNGLVSPRALLARQILAGIAAIWKDHTDFDVQVLGWL